jgi:hypothetical protein
MRNTALVAGALAAWSLVQTPASAQGQARRVTGDGSAGTLALWTNGHTIGSSNLRQGPQGGVSLEVTAEAAVYVTSHHAAGWAAGVVGNAIDSPDGQGVLGFGAVNGVAGIASGTAGYAAGVYGQADVQGGRGVTGRALGSGGIGVSGMGTDVGLEGTAAGPNGVAGQFVTAPGGNVLHGYVAVGDAWTSVFRVDDVGKGYFNGGTEVGGADFAESVRVSNSARGYAPGDLLAVDAAADRQITLASEPYSPRVAGIYSTRPGILASPRRLGEPVPASEVPLAVMGIVPCKVSAENGAIRRGDLLVASSTPGHAMKGTDRGRMLGAVVGKAMASLERGRGVIEVLVTLQ